MTSDLTKGMKVEHIYNPGLTGIVIGFGKGIFTGYINIRWFDGRVYHHPERFLKISL